MSEPTYPPNHRKVPSVGSLVRHKHLPDNPVGLVVDHYMWDADSGGFTVQFIKPHITEFGTVIRSKADLCNSWELVS